MCCEVRTLNRRGSACARSVVYSLFGVAIAVGILGSSGAYGADAAKAKEPATGRLAGGAQAGIKAAGVNETALQEARELDAAERKAYREMLAKVKADEHAEEVKRLQAKQVTYGQIITLRHAPSGGFLAATNFKYFHQHSSGQHQIVTQREEDGYTHWRVLPPAGSRWETVNGQPVNLGSTIRLMSVRTERALHSHEGPASPVSGNNEVTNHGAEQGGRDPNDNWLLSLDSHPPPREKGARDEGAGPAWAMATRVHLLHAPTHARLVSTPVSRDPKANYTMGHDEVSCVRGGGRPAAPFSLEAREDAGLPSGGAWEAWPIGGVAGFDKHLVVHDSPREHMFAEADPANGPKEISIYCPQNPVVSFSDLDYNLVSEGKCMALNLQSPHFEASLTLDCDPKKK